MMQNASSKLIEVLRVEERTFRSLRDLLASERQRMIELDAASLYELAMEKEILAEEGRLAQEARMQAATELARSLDIPDPNVTISRLCTALGDEAAPLRDAQSRLISIVAAVSELSEANQRLGGERLADVQTTLQLLGRLAPVATHESARRGGNLVRRTA